MAENEKTEGTINEVSVPEDEPAEGSALREGRQAAEPTPDVEAEASAAQKPAPEQTKKTERRRLPRPSRPKAARAGKQPSERKPLVRQPKPEAERGNRQERRGVVVSAAMDKTIVVRVETRKAHARYQKIIRRSTKFHAHDERNEANVGDLVRIAETRPISRTKRWRLVEIIEVAK